MKTAYFIDTSWRNNNKTGVINDPLGQTQSRQ